jgi:hypothetical protein
MTKLTIPPLPLIGIDPAFRTGGFRAVIVDEDKVAQAYKFPRFLDFIKWIMSQDAPERAICCVENSNLDAKMYAYHRGKQGGQLATAARNVGANQAISQATYELCLYKWPDSTYQITPKQKGKVQPMQVIAGIMQAMGHQLAGKLDEDGRAAYQCAVIGYQKHQQKR